MRFLQYVPVYIVLPRIRCRQNLRVSSDKCLAVCTYVHPPTDAAPYAPWSIVLVLAPSRMLHFMLQALTLFLSSSSSSFLPCLPCVLLLFPSRSGTRTWTWSPRTSALERSPTISSNSSPTSSELDTAFRTLCSRALVKLHTHPRPLSEADTAFHTHRVPELYCSCTRACRRCPGLSSRR